MDKFFSKINDLKQEYYTIYKPAYDRLKKETLEAKQRKDADNDDDESNSVLNKDSLIEFDDGIYGDDDESETENEINEKKRNKTINTIPEEEEEGRQIFVIELFSINLSNPNINELHFNFLNLFPLFRAQMNKRRWSIKISFKILLPNRRSIIKINDLLFVLINFIFFFLIFS